MIKILNVLFVFILILMIFLVSLIDERMGKQNKKRILLFFVMIICLFLSVRDIGLDLEAYIQIFNDQEIVSLKYMFTNSPFSDSLEPFFVLLISTLKKINFGTNWFFLISGSIPMLILYIIISKNEDKYLLTTFSFFMLLHFFRGPIDVIRHFFAAIIYLSAIYSLSRKKEYIFWSKSIFSIFVHYSNIIIMVIRPLLVIRWNIIKYFFSLMIVIIIGFTIKITLSNVDFSTYNYSTGNQFVIKAVYYLTYYNIHGYHFRSTLHFILYTVLTYFPLTFNFLFILLGLNRINMIEKNRFITLIFSSQILGNLVAIFMIILGATTLGMRLEFLLSIGNFLLVREIIFKYYERKKMLLFSITILSLMLYNFFTILYFAGIHEPQSPFFIF